MRDKFIICTKVGEEFSGHNEGRFHYNHDGKRVYTCLTRSSIIRQLDETLKNLCTDYIDIYMPHFFYDDPLVGRIDEVMETMDLLIEQGKIRSVGLSNISLEHLCRFSELGSASIACVQIYTNVLDHSLVDAKFFDFMLDNCISGVGINCLAKGLLSGAFPNDFVVSEGTERSESAWFYGDRIGQVNNMLAGWFPLRERYSASYASLSLAWVLAQRGVSHLLTGVTNPSQLKEAVGSSNILLQADELQGMAQDALSLRAISIEIQLEEASIQIRAIANSRAPVAVWGAGVTLDYLCRRLPIADCNIVRVYDSNPSLNGQIRLDQPVSALKGNSADDDQTTLIVAIPKDPVELDLILRKLNLTYRTVVHLGHLKALCK